MKDQKLEKAYSKELTTIFNQQLEYSKEIVRAFINNIFGKGIGNEYTNREIYDYFYSFNFDWLNYACAIFDKSTEAEISKWCNHPIKIRLDEIQKGFTQLTNIRDLKKLESISKLDNAKFRGTADPDSMKIVCNILFVIYSDIIRSALSNLEQDQADYIIKNKDFTYLFKGDTMHSFHSSFGYPEYNEQAVKRTIFEYIFMYPYITGFSKMKSVSLETMQKIKEFFNLYHTLGNIVLTPAVIVNNCSINKHRAHYDKDNYYSYVDKLFENDDWLSSTANNELGNLIRANKGFFSLYQGNRKGYCDALDIIDADGALYTKAKQEANVRQDDESVKKYIDVMECIIKKRCFTMINKLFDALQN